MTLRLAALAALVALLTTPAGAAAQAPDPSFVHAHRGAHTLAGTFTFGEETISAFRHAHLALGSVLEADAKITRDGVPVVFHDATLERTTPCEGLVAERTLAELDECPVDVLGAPGGSVGGTATDRTEPIPTLEQVLEFAVDAGATVNLEIKNVPTEADFDDSDAYAETVMDVVLASGIAPERLIVQSFWPPNLEVAERRMPAAPTALLTLSSLNDGGPSAAAANGYEWVSPQWPVSESYVAQAHSLGRKVVPWTLNTTGDVAAARAAGVDAVITDDPLMARRALGIPDPPAGDTTGPVVRIKVPEATWRRFRSRALELRWKGEDPSGLAGYEAQVRRVGRRTWRTVSLGSRPAVMFRARAGTAYDLRVRAQDDHGNLGKFATRRLTVPLDERALRLSGGWERVRRKGAWQRRVALASAAGEKATLARTGTRVRVIGPRLRRGGRLAITIDGERHVVSVRGRGARRTLFDSGALAARRHRVVIRSLGGGPVAVDGIAVG